jgi:hypothetical protein
VWLDKAIAMHLENERKKLSQVVNAALVQTAKIHIKVETAPRDLARLERRIAARKQDMEDTVDTPTVLSSTESLSLISDAFSVSIFYILPASNSVVYFLDVIRLVYYRR